MSNCITSSPSLWNMAQHHIKRPQLEPVAFVSLALNDSPTFPPTSSRQILQLYCPDSRAAGAQATKGRGGEGASRGWRVGGVDGKKNGQLGDKRGRNTHTHNPHSDLTSTPTHLTPDPCLHPGTAPQEHLRVLLGCPTTRDRSANCEWCHQALPGLPGCVWQGTGCRRGRAAMWREQPLYFWASRGAVMTVSYSCAHWGLPYLALQWPLISPRLPLLLA